MSVFMLFLHEDLGQFDNRSEAEMMKVIGEYSAWAKSLHEKDQHAGGEKLTDDPGKVMRNRNGKIGVTDGPYAETKELIGGYFAIKAANYDEACRIAESCPHLKYGGRIEVRMVHEF